MKALAGFELRRASDSRSQHKLVSNSLLADLATRSFNLLCHTGPQMPLPRNCEALEPFQVAPYRLLEHAQNSPNLAGVIPQQGIQNRESKCFRLTELHLPPPAPVNSESSSMTHTSTWLLVDLFGHRHDSHLSRSEMKGRQSHLGL